MWPPYRRVLRCVSSIIARNRLIPDLVRIALDPLKNSIATVTVTNRHSPKETIAKGLYGMGTEKEGSYLRIQGNLNWAGCQAATDASSAISVTPASAGHRNARFRLSNELRRHAISSPTPVRKIKNSPIGTLMRSKKIGRE